MTTSRIRISRRVFLSRNAKFAAAAGLPLWFWEEIDAATSATPPKGANERPGVALIGCGGRGTGVAKEAAEHGRVVAICDVDKSRLEQAGKVWPDALRLNDFRKVIERKDVDVIVNGTPDHWHTLVNLAAVRAGKDVYSEKPLTLTIEEGKHLVKAVQSSKRILQTGSQQRSESRFRLACELVRNGRVGKLQEIFTVLPAGLTGGPFEPSTPPENLDWDFWLGQAPKVPYVRQRCHFSFRYFLDYSGGTMTDWGAHHNDIALWGLGLDRSGPRHIEGKLLEKPVPGGFDAPSDYRVVYEYPNGVKHTCSSTRKNKPDGSKAGELGPEEMGHGVKFIGSEGWIFVTRGKIEASNPDLLTKPLPANAERLYASSNHMQNFFDCVRSRKAPVCDVEIGHRSVSLCHLGVIALRLGRKLTWDPNREVFLDDKEANAYVGREMRRPWSLEKV